MSPAAAKAAMSDRRILLVLGGLIIAVLIGVSIIAGGAQDNDTRPTTYNTGSAGAAAAFQTLQELGRPVSRWDKPLKDLDSVPAEHTTLVLAEPKFSTLHRAEEAADLKRFLERGGRVLLTGKDWASLLPAGQSASPEFFQASVCYTTPDGPGELAAAGEAEMTDEGRWSATGPQFRVEQRCGTDPVVVRFPVGRGEAIWWSSATPLSNSGLRQEGNLKLLLATLYGRGGEDRHALFDEYVQEAHAAESTTKGLPLGWLLAQFVAAFLLLVFSFSRRKGPLRMPATVPRSSPVEFATSMGDLYAKAGAADAAVEAARRRIHRLLLREAGVSRSALEAGPDATAAALHARLGGDWSPLATHLRDAANESRDTVDAKSGLALVRALGEDEERVRAALHPTSSEVTSGFTPDRTKA